MSHAVPGAHTCDRRWRRHGSVVTVTRGWRCRRCGTRRGASPPARAPTSTRSSRRRCTALGDVAAHDPGTCIARWWTLVGGRHGERGVVIERSVPRARTHETHPLWGNHRSEELLDRPSSGSEKSARPAAIAAAACSSLSTGLGVSSVCVTTTAAGTSEPFHVAGDRERSWGDRGSGRDHAGVIRSAGGARASTAALSTDVHAPADGARGHGEGRHDGRVRVGGRRGVGEGGGGGGVDVRLRRRRWRRAEWAGREHEVCCV